MIIRVRVISPFTKDVYNEDYNNADGWQTDEAGNLDIMHPSDTVMVTYQARVWHSVHKVMEEGEEFGATITVPLVANPEEEADSVVNPLG
jgi:hypothetical protein